MNNLEQITKLVGDTNRLIQLVVDNLQEIKQLMGINAVDIDVSKNFEDKIGVKEEVKEKILIEKIAEVTHRLGIPANYLGYRYLRTAITWGIENGDILNLMTKRLYPEVAKEYKTTASRVERAIRHAIESSWMRGDTDLQKEIFGYAALDGKVKPTNSEFIAAIVEYVCLNIA